MLVNCAATLQKALEFLAANDMVAFDTETTGLNTRKDKVIGFGVSNATEGFYVPIWAWQNKELQRVGLGNSCVNSILEHLTRKKLLMFNASFDYRMTKNSLGVNLLPAVHADVLLLKHLCDEEWPLSLKDIGVKLYGIDVKAEKEEMQASIKANGGTPTQFFKASLETISKYCVQDCLLTYKLYSHYSKILQRENLEAFYYQHETLRLYKEVTIPAEERGIRLDVPKMQKYLAEIKADLALLEANIQQQIAPLVPELIARNLDKDYPQETKTGKVPAWKKKHATQLEAFQADYPNAYPVNLSSKHHLKELFFKKLKLTPLSFTPTGLGQVDNEFIESIADKYEWAKQLTVYNKLIKIKGTYIEGLLEQVEGDIFYPNFTLHRTVSGRMSSNLQQLPRTVAAEEVHPFVFKYNNAVRSFIIAREGFSLIDADYESLEPKCFAHVSGDKALQSIFHEGYDFYSYIALKTERLQGVSALKSDSNYLGKLNKAARQKAKVYSLGIPYGLSAYKLKFEINVTPEAAEQLIKDYFNAFPSLFNWFVRSADEARFKGYVSTQTGRVRHLPLARDLFTEYGACIDDDLELWKRFHTNPLIYAQVKQQRKVYKNLINNARNFQIQGLAASILNRAAVAINAEFATKDMKSLLVFFCHDELMCESPDHEIDAAKEIMQRNMENIIKLDVPLVAEPFAGKCYADIK